MAEPASDSSSAPPPEHRRRPRYRGTHPRRFEEKYKELAPELYPGVVEHVRERGATPAGQHVPILVEEVLEILAPRSGERGVDATLGWGGHAERLLARLAPEGRLLALDADPFELPRTEARLRKLGHGEQALIARRTNFAALRPALHEVGWSDGVDFVLVDLGLSSMQIDDPARGFSVKLDGPLDMRLNPKRGLSAEQWLARATEEQLVAALGENADEPRAPRIARALAARRGTLRTTRDFAAAVRDALPESLDPDEVELSVRRAFQAVRIEVNDEFGALELLLRDLSECLRPGGRAAILAFHSGEDRRVKKSFLSGLKSGIYSAAASEVIRASPEERRANPRSSSAKLRWARRA